MAQLKVVVGSGTVQSTFDTMKSTEKSFAISKISLQCHSRFATFCSVKKIVVNFFLLYCTTVLLLAVHTTSTFSLLLLPEWGERREGGAITLNHVLSLADMTSCKERGVEYCEGKCPTNNYPL